MGLSIHDRVLHYDENHNFFNLCNLYLFTGGTYYRVDENAPPLDNRFTVIRDEYQLSCLVSCLLKASYLLLLPVVIAGIGLCIGRYLNDYQIANEGNPPPFVAEPIPLNQNQSVPIDPQLLLNLKNYLYRYTGLSVFQIGNEPVNYVCRAFEDAISIQTRNSEFNGSISFKINNQGNIHSILRNGVACGANIPADRRAWIVAAIEQMEKEQKEASAHSPIILSSSSSSSSQSLTPLLAAEIEQKEKEEKYKEDYSSMTSTAQGVSNAASQMIAMDNNNNEINTADLLLLANNTGKNDKPVEFNYGEKEYTLWLKEPDLFVIQSKNPYQAERVAHANLNHKKNMNKLGVRVDMLSGQVQSVYFEDQYKGSLIPTEQRNWIKAACKQIRDASKKPDLHAQFSQNDLVLFRQALMQSPNFTMNVDGKSYYVWTRNFGNQFVINMQFLSDYNFGVQDNKLGLIINKDTGKIVSIQEAGQQKDQIPERFIPALQTGLKEALRLSSKYELVNGVIHVKLVQRGLQSIPAFHLESLTRLIRQARVQNITPIINVNFLMDQLVDNNGVAALGLGIDAGGLSRTYIDGIVDGLIKTKAIDVLPDGSMLALPKTQKDYDANHPDTPSKCSPQEQTMYEALGVLMMYCNMSATHPYVDANGWVKQYSTGRYFHNALLHTLTKLPLATIGKQFEALTTAERVEMHDSIVSFTMDWDFNISSQAVQWLKTPAWNDAAKTGAQEFLAICGIEEEQGGESFKDPEILKKHLHRILISTTEHGSMAPIHAIAKGMKSIVFDPYWNIHFASQPAAKVSEQIQGSTDRQKVADSFVIAVPQGTAAFLEIYKKVIWLKIWIKDEATEEEIANLLRFFTGSSGLPLGKNIQVRSQAEPYFPCPKAHTCNLAADFSPVPVKFVPKKGIQPCPKEEDTAAAFIDVLKKWALSDPNSYGFG